MHGDGIRFISKVLFCNFAGNLQENNVKLRDSYLCAIKYGDPIMLCLQIKSFLGAFAYLRQVPISFTLSLCLTFRPSVRSVYMYVCIYVYIYIHIYIYICSAPTGRIFEKFYIGHVH